MTGWGLRSLRSAPTRYALVTLSPCHECPRLAIPLRTRYNPTLVSPRRPGRDTRARLSADRLALLWREGPRTMSTSARRWLALITLLAAGLSPLHAQEWFP